MDHRIVTKDLIIALLYQSMTGTVSAEAADDVVETLGNERSEVADIISMYIIPPM